MKYHYTWTDSELLEMFRMRDEGSTYREIAAALGKTRNAVAGKLAKFRKEGVEVPPYD